MRSSELARLAGVTVRTLRHYHRTGILPEPERDRNGYREYRVSDLIRLLRTARLRELGLSLAEIQPLLDDRAARAATLERAEAELDAEIARLNERRDRVRRLRALGLLPELGPLMGFLETVDESVWSVAKLDETELEQFVLFGHLAPQHQIDWLVRAYAELAAHESEQGADPGSVDISSRFLNTPDDAPQEVWESLLTDMLASHGDFFREFVAQLTAADLPDDPDLERVLAGHMSERMSPAHEALLTRFIAAVQPQQDGS